MPQKQVRKSAPPQPKRKVAPSRPSSKRPLKAAAKKSPARARSEVEAAEKPSLEEAIQQLLGLFQAQPPPRQLPPHQVSPEELLQAQFDLEPPEAEYGSEPDLGQISSFSPSKGHWESEHNDPRMSVNEEAMLSFRGQTEAKFDAMMQRLRTLEKFVASMARKR